MKKLEPHQRLAAARRKAGYETASEAARAFGWNENTYRSHENGERGLKHGVAAKYGRAFRVNATDILFGNDPDEVIPSSGFPALNGTIDGDGSATLLWSPKPLEIEHIVKTIFYDFLSHDIICLEFADSFLFGAFQPGDLAVFWKGSRDNSVDLKRAAGKLALIETKSGQVLFRRVREGSQPGTIDIEMEPGRPISNEEPIWIGEMFVFIQSGQWHKQAMVEWVNGDSDPLG